MKIFGLALVLVLASGCRALEQVDAVTLKAHADATADIAAENTKYIDADPSLDPAQKDVRKQRNRDTADFAKSLSEAQ